MATRKKIPLIPTDAALTIGAAKTLSTSVNFDVSGADITVVGSGSAVITFPSTTGTLAKLTDITGTNSGTNTGDNATNSQYSGLVSNATHTGDVTGATALTLATAQPAVHTWALAQTFTTAPIFTDASGSRTALGLGTLATQSGTFSGTSSGTNTGDNATNTQYSGLAATIPDNLTDFVSQTAHRVFYSNNLGDVTELALGADGTFLKSNGATSAPTFATPAGSGDVSKVGTPLNNQVGVWTGDGTLEGDANLTFDTTTDTLTSVTFAGNLTGNVTGNVSGSAGSATGNAGTVTNGVYTTGAGTVYEVPLTFGDGLTRTANDVDLDTTLAGLVSVTSTTFVGALTGTASGNLTSANIEDSVTDGHTTVAPSGNAVFDALALKAPLISPSFTTPALGTPSGGTLTSCTGLPAAGVVGTALTKATVQSKSFVISNPTAASDLPLWRVPVGITITAVHLLCKGNVLVGQLWEYDANGLNGATVDSSDITGVVDTNVNDDGTLSNAGIDAGDYIGWVTTSVTGSPTYAIITFDYTIT